MFLDHQELNFFLFLYLIKFNFYLFFGADCPHFKSSMKVESTSQLPAEKMETARELPCKPRVSATTNPANGKQTSCEPQIRAGRRQGWVARLGLRLVGQ